MEKTYDIKNTYNIIIFTIKYLKYRKYIKMFETLMKNYDFLFKFLLNQQYVSFVELKIKFFRIKNKNVVKLSFYKYLYYIINCRHIYIHNNSSYQFAYYV